MIKVPNADNLAKAHQYLDSMKTESKKIILLKANILIKEGKFENAINLLNSIDSNCDCLIQKKIYLMISFCYMKMGEDQKSIDILTKGINSLGSIDLLKDRGNLYMKIGKNDLALKDYNLILSKIDYSNNTGILLSRGKCWVNLCKYENAIQDFTKIIEIKPESPTAYVQRAKCYEKIHLTKKSEEDLKIISKIQSNL